MNTRRVFVRAPAKVNLALNVLGRRPDGYHEVDTLLLALELCDSVEVRLVGTEQDPGARAVALRSDVRADVRFELEGPACADVPADESNLALRAARAALALARDSGQAAGLELRLEKHIPVAAGLGGGSSDAAAALLGSALVLGLDPANPALRSCLTELGSDCAFFYDARDTGLARCTGRGERVEPLPALEFPWVVALVAPGFGCSTAEVYRAHREEARQIRPAPLDVRRLLAAPLHEARARLVNELEPAAMRAYPELAGFRALLEALEPGAFRLSGSGSSFFALFSEARSARSVLERVRAAAEARRCALRGSWVLRARGRGVQSEGWTSHSGDPLPA